VRHLYYLIYLQVQFADRVNSQLLRLMKEWRG